MVDGDLLAFVDTRTPGMMFRLIGCVVNICSRAVIYSADSMPSTIAAALKLTSVDDLVHQEVPPQSLDFIRAPSIINQLHEKTSRGVPASVLRTPGQFRNGWLLI